MAFVDEDCDALGEVGDSVLSVNLRSVCSSRVGRKSYSVEKDNMACE